MSDSKLSVYNPNKIKDGMFYSKIIVDDEDITIQVKKNKVVLDKENNKALLEIDSNTKRYINWVSDEVIKETSRNSESWFGKHISVDDCKSLYKNCIDEKKLKCFYDENSNFYKSKNKSVEHSELPDELLGIGLIKCCVVIFTKNSIYIRWEITEFKLKSDTDKTFTDYGIRDLDEHKESITENEIEKKLKDKLKDISLF